MEDLSKANQPETDSKDRELDVEARKKSKKIGAAAVEAQPAPGHIGRMLMTAESKLAKTEAKKTERQTQTFTNKRVETLSRTELMSLSESIMVDGSSLRQIYETHLIGERGLRRLVAEHLRGGDLNKALRLEVTEREIDFERDPAVRDMVPNQAFAAGGGANTAALNELLDKATSSVNDSTEEVAFFKARARYEATQLHQHKQQRRLMDAIVAAILAVLAGLVIMLYLSRN